MQMVISDDRLDLSDTKGNTMKMGDIVQLNASTSPSQIDLGNAGKIGYGICELKGDTLSLVIADPGLPRPTAFKGDRRGILFRLKRAK
jgi:uncharacterized protein (TIGR03067 family)